MSLASAPASQTECLFVDGFNDLSWPTLLAYFQHRQDLNNGNQIKGADKHILAAHRTLQNIFTFNNETYKLASHFDWRRNPSLDLEWLILLHKFYYLKDLAGAYDCTLDERYAQKWLGLIDTWISQVPDGFIDSQVTGRRLQQWLLSYQTFVAKWRSPTVTPDFFGRFIHSVNSQTQHLCRHLTPEGNHRTLELYSIFLVAVTFPELRSAQYYLEFSKQKLLENIQTDVLPDGVHRELSTDYHHTVLKNYLRFRELAVRNQITLPKECDALLKRALEFSYYAHKPDGFIPAINDGDCNSYLPLLKKAQRHFPNEQLLYATSQGEEGKPPQQRSRGFADSGYYILRSSWMAQPYHEALYLFFDCAQLGFGSHGHYDVLNIEMAAYGHSLVVDPGRYTYSEESPDGINWRQAFKGTSAHNTVAVNGLDQIPYRNGRPVHLEPVATMKRFVSAIGFDFMHGQVDSQQYSACHERKIFFLLPEYWVITDRLTATTDHNYDLYFHLAARAQGHVQVDNMDGYHVVSSPNLLLAQTRTADTQLHIEQGFVSPEYGVKHPAPVIRHSRQQARTTLFHSVLYPHKGIAPQLQVTEIPVYQSGRQCAPTEASALHIRIKGAGGCLDDYLFMNHQAENQQYSFADFSCTGRLLFLRLAANGHIINMQGEGLKAVNLGADTLLDLTDYRVQLSYQNQCLSLSTDHEALQVTLDELTLLVHWPGLNIKGAKQWLR